MREVLQSYTTHFQWTGNLEHDITTFLLTNNHPNTAVHAQKVGQEAERIAFKYYSDTKTAKAAGLLHDISAVIPPNKRADVAEELGLEVLKEEKIFPLIAHQKLSRVMAEDIFAITNEEILSAVECHTTLKKAATKMDKILFVADKIEWDQPGAPPYLNTISSQLEVSLEHAAFAYISYLWERKETLKVVHPWLRDAYNELKQINPH
nr:HD domain-containing protein [Salsuginibacillus kocurii]